MKNKPIGYFRVALKLHYESEALCKAFVREISFYSYASKSNFLMKVFALSLAFT